MARDGYAAPVDPIAIETLLLYIAANIRRHREKLGLTQEAFAEAAGIDIRYFQQIESGRKKMSLDVIVALANALEVSPASLLRPATMPEVKRGRPRKRPRP